MYFLDLFSGIGGFRLGMEQAGHKCAGYVEIDKFARKSYEAIHDTEGEWTAHDITTVTDESIRGLEGVDVICGGFPCQAFSVAGKRGGFDDIRGTLFFEIARFANILRPRYLFLENVTGLLSHDNGNTFETILGALDEIGYDAEWSCINSKRFVPQNRERVFIIGHSRAERTRKVFPITGQGNENTTIGKSTKTAIARTFTAGGHSAGNHSGMTILSIPTSEGISKTVRAGGRGSLDKKHNHDIVAVLTPDRAEKRQNGRRFKEPGEPMFTLTSQDRHGVLCLNTKDENGNQPPQQDRVYSTDGLMTTISAELNGRFNIRKPNDYRIRKLTPRECFRLQGFPDLVFNRAAEVNYDSQLYKQAGNSVTVNVIYEIAKRL